MPTYSQWLPAGLVIIGIGETQIVASESRGGHHAHLLANGWFVVGLVAVPDRA